MSVVSQSQDIIRPGILRGPRNKTQGKKVILQVKQKEPSFDEILQSYDDKQLQRINCFSDIVAFVGPFFLADKTGLYTVSVSHTQNSFWLCLSHHLWMIAHFFFLEKMLIDLAPGSLQKDTSTKTRSAWNSKASRKYIASSMIRYLPFSKPVDSNSEI